MITGKNGRRSRNGQMPLALVAVVLLVTGSFFSMVYADIERATENSENMAAELVSLDAEVERAEFEIEAELGDIISAVSSCKDGGTLVDRTKMFNELVDEHFKNSYPRFERGVSTSIASSDIRLELETMRSDTDGFFTGGGCASFFKAVGTVEAVLKSESASCSRTFSIEADASSGLPLVIEAATGFELSAEGGMSMLTQMMEYQLTCLAQHRVMQGYGMTNGSGTGTDDIITEKDAEKAFRNAVRVLQTMFFRSNSSGDGEMVNACQVDVADLISSDEGYLYVNIGSLMSQALLSGLDSYVVKWVDYLKLDAPLDLVDGVTDVGRKLVRGICGFITGDDMDVKEIRDHILCQLNVLGISEEEVLRPFRGDVIAVELPEYRFTVEMDSETVTADAPTGTVGVPLPDVEIMEWSGWKGFMDRYDSERNAFKDSLKGMLRDVAQAMCSDIVFRIPVNAFDERSFRSEYTENLDRILSYGTERLTDKASESIRSSKISDPLMIATYKDVRDNAHSVYRADEFEAFLRHTLDEIAFGQGSQLSGADGKQLDEYRQLLETEAIAPAVREFESRMEEELDRFRVITTAEEKSTGFITRAVADSVSGLIGLLDLVPSVEKAVQDMYSEMLEYSCVSPFDGPMELPAEKTFKLKDSDGNGYDETVEVSDRMRIETSILPPTERKDNQHMTAVNEFHRASYVSYFTVTLKADVSYTVRSTNPVYRALGLYDAVLPGEFSVDTVIEVPCISAWALAGTDYEETNSLIGDVWNALLLLLEPLIEPLKKMIKAMQVTSQVLSAAVMEFAGYLGEVIRDVYDTLMLPLNVFFKITGSMLAEIAEGIALIGVDLTGKGQTLSFEVLGMTLTVHLNLRSLSKETKELCSITLSKEFDSGTGISATVTLKKDSDGFFPMIGASAHGNDWNVCVTADPLQKDGPAVVCIEGRTRTVEYSGTMPDLVQYKMVDAKLSDIPAVGTAISNIPLPIPNVKGSLDAGFCLKYDIPLEHGVLINEVESNPTGDDKGKEWVEILNKTSETVDLDGYRIVPASKENKAVTLSGPVLAPGQRTTVVFEKTTLNNRDESVKLIDPLGETADECPQFSDGNNSDYTWQRLYDGCMIWKSRPSSYDSRNGGTFIGTAGIGPTLLDITKDAAGEVLDEMGGKIGTADDLGLYLKNVLTRITDKTISMLSGCIVDASVFLEAEFTDYIGSGHAGIRISIGCDGDLIDDGIRYLLSMVPLLAEYVNNPDGMTAERVLFQDIYLRTVFYTGVSMPSFLGSLADTQQNAGLSVRTNLSAITELMGEGRGQWRADAGLVLENVPTSLLPPVFDADPRMSSDLWLINMHFQGAEETADAA